PLIYFQTTGTQTIRIQTREDGLSIDQIVLSPQSYLNSSPGSLKNDTRILPSTIGGQPPPPPSNQSPHVTISATPTSGTAPLTVNFTSNASDPDGFIASYHWTFGNGNTSTHPAASNTYQSAGTYTARLTVTDNAGATASASVTITVNGSSPSPGSSQIKVLSWNVAFGRGTDNVVNFDRTATWIANTGADLVGLCEMPPANIPSLVTMLTQKTGRTWYWHFVAKYSGCPEGNLILSRYPITSASHRYLSYQRSVARVTVSIGGKNVNFFATHLDPDSSSVRTVQINELKSFAAGFAEPRIIVGDFNAGPDWPEIIHMSSSYYDGWMEAMFDGTATAYPDNPVGMHTRTRRGRLDYVFYSRDAWNLSVKGAQIPDSRDLSNPNVAIRLGTLDDKGVRPSDHNLMILTLEIR
ncbi:MAG TPA: endonuclease/exonuclease/phosphatase family protein, partial [Blastocatellia bacterium]|nr:endonuclease/exonuclease/phosphatase family protein [Blastocatellia bacterium]